MSGNRFVLDTNAVINLLKGNHQVLSLIASAEYLAISVISHIEFNSFSGLSDEDRALYEVFVGRIDVLGLSVDDDRLMSQVAQARTQSNLKLPDAIIASTALVNDAVLITADLKLLKYLEDSGVGYD